jgi:diaminopimelate decarboxylase
MNADYVKIANRFGTPIYVYDFDAIQERICTLKSLLHKDIRIFYAVKANPNVHLLASLKPFIDGLDISSSGEFKLALDAGYRGRSLSFAGPGKAEQEMAFALKHNCGSISVESVDELDQLIQVAQTSVKKSKANISVRVNPVQEIKEYAIKMGGGASPFGIDEENLADAIAHIKANQDLLQFIGIHVYAGTQCLSVEGLRQNIRNVLDIANAAVRRHGAMIKRINFGGGFGIPYFSNERDFDLERYARLIQADIEAFETEFSHSIEYVIELGRYIVGPFGYYLSKVLATKESRGRKFIILDGGIHHNLPVSGQFGQIIKRNHEIINITNPQGPEETVDIAGCLCTPLDRLANHITLPKPEVGHVLMFKNCGAYGLTASPLLFLGHDTPSEILIKGGNVEIIREGKDITHYS